MPITLPLRFSGTFICNIVIEQTIKIAFDIPAKKINIIGAVKNPGTYIVSPFSTITSSLAYSGGFEDYASLRNIVVKRGQKEIIFDLYDFLLYACWSSF